MKIRPMIWVPAAFVAIAVSAVGFLLDATSAPKEFFVSRSQGAAIAETLQQLTRQSLSRIAQIAEYDQSRNANAALLLISQEINEHTKSQELAAELASQMEVMARLMPSINPESAREDATEGISAGLALVSRLVTYNNLIRELFGVLQQKLVDEKNTAIFDGRVNSLIDEINTQAKAINEFNRRLNDAMAEFDDKFD